MAKIRIAIDCMGGDLGPAELIEGVNKYHAEHPEVEFVLVGNKEDVEKKGYEFVESTEVIPMTAGAMEALRAKNSSMLKAIGLVKSKDCQAVISTGGTGAYLSAAAVSLKKAPNVMRPALITPFPTKIKGKQVIILDVGASNENSSEEVAQFAHMGDIYARAVTGIEKPKVYLLSNGTEEGKGSPVGKEAYRILKEEGSLNFCGNIEAREALSGEADVIATDGYSGNILLKGSEGVAKMMSGMLKSAFKRNVFSKIGYLFTRKGIKDMTETMDYKRFGGALLMGVNGIVIKAHGNSDSRAFYYAIDVGVRLASANLLEQVEKGLAK